MTTSFIHTTKNALTCAMILIVCFLAAVLAVQEICSLRPSSAKQWGGVVAIGALFLVVAAYLCHRTTECARHDAEAFADMGDQKYEWGYDPNLLLKDAPIELTAAGVPEGGTRIVGPEVKPGTDGATDEQELITWQYNPQNTLVDYKFYEVETSDPSAAPQRMAPVVNGRVGKQ